MSSTLTTLRARARTLLMDASGAIWDDAALEEGLRLALGEYQLAAARAVTLAGLDGAAVTSLDAQHDLLLVLGGAAYAALARAVDRAESVELGAQAADLKTWGEARLREFKAMLCVVYPSYRPALGGALDTADPARQSAEIALLSAQTSLTQAQSAAATGEESRAAGAASQSAADRASEAARLADLRKVLVTPWGRWEEWEE
ncbi:MAG TPA: hypothetical protein VF832_09365 [Longimicrobiales bacterium]